MRGLDHSLLHQARNLVTGANVHRLKTWIFCYETSKPRSLRRKRYEKLLRTFVNTKNLTIAARLHAKLAVKQGERLRMQSIALDEEVKRALLQGDPESEII
jgi:hypothetical protein